MKTPPPPATEASADTAQQSGPSDLSYRLTNMKGFFGYNSPEWQALDEAARQLQATGGEWHDCALDSLIAAAERHAESYDGDDRPNIKTDVLNAFYAGSRFAAPAAAVGGGSQVDPAHEKMREMLRNALDADTDNNETLWVLVTRAANALYWRGKEIEELKAAAATPKQAPPAGGFVVDDLPDDATNLEVIEYFIHVGRTMKPIGHWPGERLYAAIERALNTPHRFIAEADRVPYRGHNGRGGDAEQSLPPFTPTAQPSAKDGVREPQHGGPPMTLRECMDAEEATTASGLVDDAMVERAYTVFTETVQQDNFGDMRNGEAAMRAALQAVWPGQKRENSNG